MKNSKRKKLLRKTMGANQSYSEGTATNPRLKATILEVVENQLPENDPPETRQTLERLLAMGYSHEKAVEMIGSAVAGEIWTVLAEEKPFDIVRFRAALGVLG